MQKLHVLALPALTERPLSPLAHPYAFASASALPCLAGMQRHLLAHIRNTAQYAKQSTRRLSWRCCRRHRHRRHCLMQQLLRRWRRSRVPDGSATS